MPASNYRGVSWDDKEGRWRAHIREGWQTHDLGTFATEEAAARAHDEEATREHTNPILNFLPDGSLNPDRNQIAGASRRTPRGQRVESAGAEGSDSGGGSQEGSDSEEEGEEEGEEGGSGDDGMDGAGGGSKERASRFRGVQLTAKGRKWKAQIYYKGRTKYIATFDTEEAAARGHDEEANRLYCNPVLNFLPDGSVNPDRHKRSRLMTPRKQVAEDAGAEGSDSGGGSQEGSESEEEREEDEEGGSDDDGLGGAGGGKERAFIYRSVSRSGDKWRVYIYIDGQQRYVGTFDDEEAAARAHDGAAKRLYRKSVVV